jgi:hypothetical protein
LPEQPGQWWSFRPLPEQTEPEQALPPFCRKRLKQAPVRPMPTGQPISSFSFRLLSLESTCRASRFQNVPKEFSQTDSLCQLRNFIFSDLFPAIITQIHVFGGWQGASGKTLEEGPTLGYNGAGFYSLGEVT